MLYSDKMNTQTHGYFNVWCGLVIIGLVLQMCFCAADEHIISVSQISPKSDVPHLNRINANEPAAESSAQLLGLPQSQQPATPPSESDRYDARPSVAAKLPRSQRSASPNLSDDLVLLESSRSAFDQRLEHVDTNDVEATEGRYFNFIKPTSTAELTGSQPETSGERTAKELVIEPFLANGGPRQNSSGPQLSEQATVQLSPATTTETSITTSSEAETTTASPSTSTAMPQQPRQNANPDIQDIITGIVKLLNGNVNIHTNAQLQQQQLQQQQHGIRKPYPSRINNRGPPRISEAQPLPNDFEQIPPPLSTHRPPPYPFDRPLDAGPQRPFINGVPLPEQVVPSMQSNYRPGFISQNRPPWQRPRPRPPIPGHRRPIPPYKPIPATMPEYRPEDDPQYTTPEIETNGPLLSSESAPTDSSYDPSGYAVEEEFDDTIDIVPSSVDLSTSTTTSSSKAPPKKDDFSKKKDKTKASKQSAQATPASSVATQSSIVESAPELEIVPSTTTTTITTTMVSTTEISEPASTDSDAVVSSSIEPSFVENASPKDTSTATSITPSLSTKLPALAQSVSYQQHPPTDAPLHTYRPYGELPGATAPSKTGPNPHDPYQPRPGIVLDDPEFKPGGSGRHPIGHQHQQRPPVQPTRPVTPPGYGEIFDVTLSAIQGPGGGGGAKQTFKINPYGGHVGNGDIIVSPNGEDGFVSIDGKRTYLNLFGDSTETDVAAAAIAAASTTRPPQLGTIVPTSLATAAAAIGAAASTAIRPTQQQVLPPGVTGTGYAVVETEQPPARPSPTGTSHPIAGQALPIAAGAAGALPAGHATARPAHYRPRSTQPPVRIDTCIVGDDSTCDQAQNERCKTDSGVSSCHCRPGYSRRKHREPCRRVVSLLMSLRVDKFYERRIVWDKLLADRNSDAYGQLSFEAVRAIDSAMSMTPFSDEFMDARVNKIYNGNAAQGAAGVFVNLTVQLEENGDTLRPNVKQDIQKHLLGVIHRRNNNIGNSVLYVDSPAGAVSNLQDMDECSAPDLNDCHSAAACTNVWGSFRCECPAGLRDPWSDQAQRAGRECQACPEAFCNGRGQCAYEGAIGGVQQQVCTCSGNYYGAQCEIDGEVLGVAIGASVTAVIIIVLTLVCLVMWSRRWHREQKNAMGSPVFGYMAGGAQVKTPGVGPTPYQVTLEDRMRWAQIADVMAQSNHYGADPVGSTRPSSAMFGYPNLQMMGTMGTMQHSNMGTLNNMGTMQMTGTMPMHTGTLPPIPMPRQGLNLYGGGRSSGMRTLENSSSSEEEDRTDLLGRHFQVPRPKSRSNGSIANQSGIYYDVDYAPSGGGGGGGGGGGVGMHDLYGGTQTTTASGTTLNASHQNIPMSTYTAGRVPSSYYK